MIYYLINSRVKDVNYSVMTIDYIFLGGAITSLRKRMIFGFMTTIHGFVLRKGWNFKEGLV